MITTTILRQSCLRFPCLSLEDFLISNQRYTTTCYIKDTIFTKSSKQILSTTLKVYPLQMFLLTFARQDIHYKKVYVLDYNNIYEYVRLCIYMSMLVVVVTFFNQTWSFIER